jgi:predicted nucleotide-binding protein (sugar kinase/HSP70/actin superfamily)
VLALMEEYPDLDYIFIPRYVSVHEDAFYCPKFMILPEAVQYGLNPKIKILSLEVNAKKRKGIESAIEFGKILGFTQEQAGKAWYFAFEKYKSFQEKAQRSSWLEQINQMDTNPKHTRNKKIIKQQVSDAIKGKFPLNILLLGHAYNVYENYINMDMEARLKAMDCDTFTIEMMPDEVFLKPVTINKRYHNYWENEDEILKTARYYLKEHKGEVDGIIFLISFACGPDSLIQELVMRDTKKMNMPYLALILDEHSGESGLVTRIESFIEMIRREKFGELSQ